MSRFKVGQIDLVPFTTGDALQCHQVGERADWGLHPVDATSLRASKEIHEAHSRDLLSKQVEVAVWRSKVDRAVTDDAAIGDRRAVRTSRPPALDQSANALHVGGVRIEDSVDIPGRPHYPMADQRNAANQDIADTGVVQVFQDSTETGHRPAASCAA